MNKEIKDFIKFMLFFGGGELGQELDDYFEHSTAKKQSVESPKSIFDIFSDAFNEVEAQKAAADKKNKARYELAKKQLQGVDSCLTKAEDLIYDEDKYFEAAEIILVNIGYLRSITPQDDFEIGDYTKDYYTEIMDEIEAREGWGINLLYTCAECAAHEWTQLSRREALLRLYLNFVTSPSISDYYQMQREILDACESLCQNKNLRQEYSKVKNSIAKG